MLERAPVDSYEVPTTTDVASKTRSGLEEAQHCSQWNKQQAMLVKVGCWVEISRSGASSDNTA